MKQLTNSTQIVRQIDIALIFVVLVIFSSSYISEAKNAGVLAFVSNHGTDDVVKATSNYYAEQLLHNVYKFKDISGTFLVGIWDWDWSLSNIQFQKVSKPYAKAWTDKYLHIVLNDLSMDLTGDFDAHSKHRLFEGRGKLYAHVCFHLQVTFSIGLHNTVQVEQCFAGFECPTNIVLNMNTDYPNFVNDWIQDKMQTHLKAQMLCDGMSKFATDYQVYTVIHDPGFAIDLSIKNLLRISDEGLSMALNGEVFEYAKGPQGDNNPMVAPPMPASINFNKYKMTTFVVSPYMISTLFLTSQRIGMFDEVVKTEELPPDERIFFSTDCIDECIGKQIPQIGKKFPKQFVSFKVTGHETIRADIDQGGIALQNGGQFTFFIGNVTLFTMGFDLTVNATPSIKPNTVLVDAILNEFKFKNIGLVYSNIGHIPNDVLEQLANIISKVNILPEIHKTFDKGVDMATFICVPHKDKLKRQIVHFIDVELELQKGVMIIAADFTLKIKSLGLHNELTDNSIQYLGHRG